MVPAVPPNLFTGIVGTKPLPERSTQMCLSDVRRKESQKEDPVKLFQNKDKLSNGSSGSFLRKLNTKLCKFGTVYSQGPCDLILFSKSRNGPVFHYTVGLKICEVGNERQIKFEAYSGVKRVVHPAISSGVVTKWTQFDEALRFVTRPTEDEKSAFIMRQIQLLNNRDVCVSLYDQNDLCQAFSWHTRSRALYQELRTHLTLPSWSTLQALTRKTKNMKDEALFKNFFTSQDERSRACVLIVDEIYVKATVTYSGKTLLLFIYVHMCVCLYVYVCVYVCICV